MIRNISFGGIYNIKFPRSFSDDMVEKKKNLIDKHIKDENFFHMHTILRKNVPPESQSQSTTDILLLAYAENPYHIYSTVSLIDKKLGDQYLDKITLRLNLDTVA